MQLRKCVDHPYLFDGNHFITFCDFLWETHLFIQLTVFIPHHFHVRCGTRTVWDGGAFSGGQWKALFVGHNAGVSSGGVCLVDLKSSFLPKANWSGLLQMLRFCYHNQLMVKQNFLNFFCHIWPDKKWLFIQNGKPQVVKTKLSCIHVYTSALNHIHLSRGA